MQERERRRVQPAGPDPDGGLFDDPGAYAGLATVAHGTYVEQLPVSGMSVEQVRTRFRDRLDIHPQAVALVDGSPVDEHTLVGTGQLLTFVRVAGEKGAR
jgi:hypothetical protein